MGKRKIYWWVQQIDDLGGAEMVSINIANQLVDEFDVTLIVSAELKKPITYQIKPEIKIINLGFKKEFARLDQSLAIYRHGHHYIKILKLLTYTFKMVAIKRNKIRKQVENYLDNDAILIASSLDSYLFAPKKKKVYFHFHFDAKNFLSLFNRIPLLISRKPDKWIFLTEGIKNEVIYKKPKLTNKVVAINNVTRFEPTLNLKSHDNRIVFIGRYANQKNPLLALESINELKKQGFPFHFDMYGMGPLEEKMKKYIQEQNLNDFVTINPPCLDPSKVYINADALLMTSKFEGIALVKIEANAFSVPVVLRNWGKNINEIATFNESIIVNGNNPSDYAIAIKNILQESNRSRYRNKSYEYSKRFTYEAIMPKWRELLNE